MPLAPAKGAEAPSRATEGAHEGAKAAALVEHDFSHWAGHWLRDWGAFDTLDTARAQLSGRRGIGWTMSAPR